MLHIKNISKKFGSKIVLDSISCDIKKGTIAILLGGSGAGKSTLLRIITGLEHHDTGSLVYNNHPLKNESVGMVFQHFNLFENLTVKDNIAFGLYAGRTHYDRKEADTIAVDLLKRYNLKDFEDNFPDELSGGQKQRLAILRTIAQKPDIICFDEPTSALDPLLKTYVAQTIIDLSHAGYTIIVATHDIHLVEQLTGSIMLMKSGSIIEKATSEEFASDSAKFPELKKYMYYN